MYGLVLCAMLMLGAWGDESASKEAAVRNMFREMLHIQPPASSSRAPSRHLAAPRHMLDLYQQYTSRQPADTATTTIRNILPLSSPSLGSVGTKELLLFNVSCVLETEEVRLAQLQLNRRRLNQRHHHKRLLAPPYRVRLYQATPVRLVPLASVPVSMVQRSAWGAVDITEALKELLLDPRASRRVLAVSFESPAGKQISPSHFLRGVPNTPHAFLVVFTEDSEENEVAEDGSQPSPRPPVHTHAMVQKLQQGPHAALFRDHEDEEDNNPQIIPLFNGARKPHYFTRNNTAVKVSSTVSTSKIVFSDQSDNSDTSGDNLLRKTRSIIDNQLPDDDDNLLDTQVPKTLSESLLATRTDLLRYAESSSKKLKKGKKGKRKRGKKQKYSSLLDSRHSAYQNTEEGAGAGVGACTMRKLTVNFSEIGWGEWIISPDKFDANYCTGSCRFPLTKSLKPSNHATLQSLVHALGRYPSVPAPACVPHQMSAITLLYFDETLNVVLKNYPSMIVESCACR